MPQLPPPLPTNRAFVVQLRAQPPGAPLSWDGRVEHVVSGKAEIEQRVLHILRTDPQIQTEFLNRVAAPIANKLFECGLIP